tara:strand:+ start:13 stop:273 length:261 start_codon:yes stop_codon:yes gene_type:complete
MLMKFDNSESVSRMGTFRLENRNSVLDQQFQARNAEVLSRRNNLQLEMQRQQLQNRVNNKCAAIKNMRDIYKPKTGGGCGSCGGAK